MQDSYIIAAMNDIEKEILLRIKEGMKTRHINQVQMAKILGVKQSTVSRMLQGAPYPSIGQLYEIAKALDMSIYYLIGIQEESYRELSDDAAKVADAYSSSERVVKDIVKRVLQIND